MKTQKHLIALLVSSILLSSSVHAQFSLDSLLGKKDDNKEQQAEDFSDFDVSSPIEQLGKKDISTSKSVGQVLGGIIGGYACHKKLPSMPFRDLAILKCIKVAGDYIGDLGGMIGEAVAIRRLSYASEYEFLESEITAAESAIETREAALKKTTSEIEKASKRTQELKAKQVLTTAEIEEAKKLKIQADAKLEENLILTARYEDTLAYLEDTLEDSKENIADLQTKKKETEGAYKNLVAKRDNLTMLLANVQLTTEQLKEDRTVLSALIAG